MKKRLLFASIMLLASCELLGQSKQKPIKPAAVIVKEKVSFTIDFGSKYGGDLITIKELNLDTSQSWRRGLVSRSDTSFFVAHDQRCYGYGFGDIKPVIPNDTNYCRIQVHLNSKFPHRYMRDESYGRLDHMNIDDPLDGKPFSALDASGNMYMYMEDTYPYIESFGILIPILYTKNKVHMPDGVADTIYLALLDTNINESLVDEAVPYQRLYLYFTGAERKDIDTTIPFPGYAN